MLTLLHAASWPLRMAARLILWLGGLFGTCAAFGLIVLNGQVVPGLLVALLAAVCWTVREEID